MSTELVVIPQGIRTRDWPRATQCSGRKEDGSQCRRRATRGARVCFAHGAKVPSVRAAAEAEVPELRARALSIADRALDVVEDSLEHSDPAIRLKAVAQLLDRTLPKLTPGTVLQVNVGTGVGADGGLSVNPADVIRARLAALPAEKAEVSVVGPTFAESLEQDTIEGLEGELIEEGMDWG